MNAKRSLRSFPFSSMICEFWLAKRIWMKWVLIPFLLATSWIQRSIQIAQSTYPSSCTFPPVLTLVKSLLADTSYCVQPVGYISTYPGRLTDNGYFFFSIPCWFAIKTCTLESCLKSRVSKSIFPKCVRNLLTCHSHTGYGGTTVTAIQPDSTSSLAFTPFSNIYANPTGTPIPIANGTRLDCVSYSWLFNTSSLDCWSWAAANGLSSEELVAWNPSLGNATEAKADAIYDYPCTPAVSSSYCVALAYDSE